MILHLLFHQEIVMWRYVLILLVLIGLAPLVPEVVENRLASRQTDEQVTERAADTGSDGRIHRIKADRRGHFTARTELNGRYVNMLVDTGATVTALPASVAENVGIFPKDSDFKYKISTANGVTLGARAVINRLEIGSIYLTKVEAIVLHDDSLREPLLGMSALKQLHKFDISGETLLLVQ